MFTTRVEMSEAELRKEVITEPVSCGTSITTRYFAADGELVRQDVEIQADPAKIPGLGAEAGDI